ncbi:hypothetical protein [Dactylosporangium sp. NPDC051541]|uniref:hypothetical protein n=1 Tax=Dactylosporangium sp. NPDC051541 TaxID=3363977 RepID=UPI0037AE8B8E
MRKRFWLVLLALTVTGCGGPAATPAPVAGPSSPVPSPSVPAPSPSPSRVSPPAPPPSSAAPVSPKPTAAVLVQFGRVRDGGTGGATETTGPGADPRIFEFVLAGCQNDGAALTITATRVTAKLTGGEGTACYVPEWYKAVFAVPAGQVPPGARLG